MTAEVDYRNMSHYFCGRGILEGALVSSGHLRVGHHDIGGGMEAVGWNASRGRGCMTRATDCCGARTLTEDGCLA